MWAFLFLAGLFSGWWGALSLAAPPESAVAAPQTSSTPRNSLRTLLFPLTENPEPELADSRDHLEPYRYNAGKRHSTSLRRRESKFRYDSLPRIRYGEGFPLQETLMSPVNSWDTALALFSSVEGLESTVERPRVARAAKNRKERTRTRADSPREQRRQGRNKERRGQNWCPDVDVGNRAYLAPTVFEGKARSMSSARKPESNYAVTFEVKRVYKSQSGFQPLVKNDSVRLHFRDKMPGKSTSCENSGIGGLSAPGVVQANIKRGKVYLVFVSRVGPRNFTILGEPIIRSKKNAQAVQAVVRPDYVREVTLSELRDAVARLQEKVKLVCRTRGSPPPRVHWLKDGMPLHPRRGLRIQHKRRRSKVVIASAVAEDSGRYECVAESTAGHRAALAAKLLVTHAPETTTAVWPRQEAPCPISEDFCMNGGTCLFFETVGEPACRCAEGFTGLRCENKDVTSTGKMDKYSSFAEDISLARF
ncbi:protein vein isoform X2 [Diprion similis]|uniref:protein vein isoform X2 n=1 Tax=Diprion similis TaxID=362088 RepID=UPI001EF8BE41|nr:protein vein isoform X2 [Diprion similis]